MLNIEHIKNCNLKNYSTFKIGGQAKCVWFPQNTNEFITLLNNISNTIVLGSGSNTLFSTSFIDKDIIITTKMDKYEITDNILSVECGAKAAMIANKLAEQGLSGLEFLIGFPARFGGAIYQNAGAKGQTISDTFLSAQVYDVENKKIIELNKTDMQFDYRKSILSEKKYILLNAKFCLTKVDANIAQEKIKENINFRQQHQPMLNLPNIGSIFKNPDGYSAGKLIEDAGFKGIKIGGAKVWENHANFIINYDNATALDVLKLMYEIKQGILEKFDINLYSEINYISGNDEEENTLWKLLQK